VRRVGLALALLAPVVATSAALASCPPYTAPAAAPGPSPGGTATGSGHELLDALRRYLGSPLIVTPLSGPAPLEIEIRWFDYRYPDVARFDFDFGDGTVDASVSMEGEHYPQRHHRFTSPGRYTVTVHLHPTTGGRTTSLREPVHVWAPDAFERELQARWSTLKDALRRRDLTAALECFTVSSRAQYEAAFRVLFIDRATNVDDVMTSIRLVRYGRAHAIYEMARKDDSRTMSFGVRFAIDADGVWRLESI